MIFCNLIKFHFLHSWEQRKFVRVFDGLQNNTLSRADLNYEGGTVKNVHYGDVLIKFGDYIDASKTELPYISDSTKADKFKSSFLQDGDIIIADTAEDDTVGKCTEIQGSEGLKLLSGLHTVACRPKEKYNELSGAKIQRGDIIYCLRGTLGKNAFIDNFDSGTVASSLVDIRPKKIVGKYLFQVLNSDIEYRQRTINDEGAAQPNLSAKNLSLFDIPMSNKDEQTKIAEYFSNLDNLITLHQRLYVLEKK